MWPSQMPPQHQQQQQQQQPPPPKTLGMTSAISLAPPKSNDIQKTRELYEALIPFNVFESDSELNFR